MIHRNYELFPFHFLRTNFFDAKKLKGSIPGKKPDKGCKIGDDGLSPLSHSLRKGLRQNLPYRLAIQAHTHKQTSLQKRSEMFEAVMKRGGQIKFPLLIFWVITITFPCDRKVN